MSMNLTGLRPMKSATPDQGWDFSQLVYPLYASPKLDGIRCVVHPELGPLSNTLKPIPNEWIQQCLRGMLIPYLDGELLVGDIAHPNAFNQTQSGVMTHGGKPNFTYAVFDNFEMGHTCGFGLRQEDAKSVVARALERSATAGWTLMVLPQVMIDTHEQLLAYEEEQLALGYEGVITRLPSAKYKFGRSTLREQGMVKMKRFIDDEAIIVGWEPLERNLNDPKVDALGLQKRGYSKDGKVIDDDYVGKFIAEGVPGSRWAGIRFGCGSGLDEQDRLHFREAIRTNVDSPIGKRFTYKYQQHGSIDAPRMAIWKGIRLD